MRDDGGSIISSRWVCETTMLVEGGFGHMVNSEFFHCAVAFPVSFVEDASFLVSHNLIKYSAATAAEFE